MLCIIAWGGLCGGRQKDCANPEVRGVRISSCRGLVPAELSVINVLALPDHFSLYIYTILSIISKELLHFSDNEDISVLKQSLACRSATFQDKKEVLLNT